MPDETTPPPPDDTAAPYKPCTLCNHSGPDQCNECGGKFGVPHKGPCIQCVGGVIVSPPPPGFEPTPPPPDGPLTPPPPPGSEPTPPPPTGLAFKMIDPTFFG